MNGKPNFTLVEVLNSNFEFLFGFPRNNRMEPLNEKATDFYDASRFNSQTYVWRSVEIVASPEHRSFACTHGCGHALISEQDSKRRMNVQNNWHDQRSKCNCSNSRLFRVKEKFMAKTKRTSNTYT